MPKKSEDADNKRTAEAVRRAEADRQATSAQSTTVLRLWLRVSSLFTISGVQRLSPLSRRLPISFTSSDAEHQKPEAEFQPAQLTSGFRIPFLVARAREREREREGGGSRSETATKMKGSDPRFISDLNTTARKKYAHDWPLSLPTHPRRPRYLRSPCLSDFIDPLSRFKVLLQPSGSPTRPTAELQPRVLV